MPGQENTVSTSTLPATTKAPRRETEVAMGSREARRA